MTTQDKYRITICVETEKRARSKEKAEQLARKISHEEVINNAGMSHFDLAGSMAEKIEGEENE